MKAFAIGLLLARLAHRRGRRFLNHRRGLSNLHGVDQPQKECGRQRKLWILAGWIISGLNISGERDMVGGGDFDAIIAWMDHRASPLRQTE